MHTRAHRRTRTFTQTCTRRGATCDYWSIRHSKLSVVATKHEAAQLEKQQKLDSLTSTGFVLIWFNHLKWCSHLSLGCLYNLFIIILNLWLFHRMGLPGLFSVNLFLIWNNWRASWLRDSNPLPSQHISNASLMPISPKAFLICTLCRTYASGRNIVQNEYMQQNAINKLL